MTTMLEEIVSMEETHAELERRPDIAPEDMMVDLERSANQIFAQERKVEELEGQIDTAERRVTKSRKTLREVTEKLAQLQKQLTAQQEAQDYELSALSLDGLRGSIGTRFWSNQVFKDFQKAYRAIAKEAGDHASMINGLKHQPLSYKKALQKGISFYIDHLEVLYEAGKEAFDASEELAIAESEEEAQEVKAGKLAPPIIVFDFPKPQVLLKAIGLQQEQIDRLPLKGSFSCIISDKGVRQKVAAKGVSSAELAKVSEAAALAALKEHLLAEAKKLLNQLDDDKITDVEATKRWRKVVVEMSEVATISATAALEEQLDLELLDTLAKVKFGFTVAGRVLATATAVVGGVLSGMVANVPGVVMAVVAGVKSVVGLITDVRRFMKDIEDTLMDAQRQIEDISKKFKAKLNSLRDGIKGKFKAKETAEATLRSFINNLMGYDFFATLSRLSATIGEAKDKLINLELKQNAAGRGLDEALKDQEALQKLLRQIEAEEMPEAIEREVGQMLALSDSMSAKIGGLVDEVTKKGTNITLLQQHYKRLKKAATDLDNAKPSLKWAEITGQILGTLATIAANQLAVTPDVMSGADVSLALSKDVLSYSSSISTTAATVTGLIKDYV